VAVALEGLAIQRFLAIQLCAFPENLADAVHLRAVRIVDALALRVVLTVNGSPFLGHHARGEPKPESEEVAGDRMQVQRTMRLVAVQINGHRGYRYVRHDQRVNDVTPPWQIVNA
jgi:hypothetical protein